MQDSEQILDPEISSSVDTRKDSGPPFVRRERLVPAASRHPFLKLARGAMCILETCWEPRIGRYQSVEIPKRSIPQPISHPRFVSRPTEASGELAHQTGPATARRGSSRRTKRSLISLASYPTKFLGDGPLALVGPAASFDAKIARIKPVAEVEACRRRRPCSMLVC